MKMEQYNSRVSLELGAWIVGGHCGGVVVEGKRGDFSSTGLSGLYIGISKA